MSDFMVNKVGAVLYRLTNTTVLGLLADPLWIIGMLVPIALINILNPISAIFNIVFSCFAIIIGTTCFLGAMGLEQAYRESETPAQYQTEAAQIMSILKQRGSLPIAGIIHFTPQRLKNNLTPSVISAAIAESSELEEDGHTGMVNLRHGVGPANKAMVPVPADANYVAGYYQMYNRLQLVRHNPELADVSLDMLDNLYATDDLDADFYLTNASLQLK